jgi:hypothetical protein
MKQVKIGCDPEFMILASDGKIVPSLTICDDENLKNHFGREVGQGGWLFELRPDPSTNIFALLANIRKIMKIHIRKFPYLKKCIFIGGHAAEDHFAIGGHIHISTDEMYSDDLLESNFKRFINKIIYSGFMHIINDKEGQYVRQTIGYGKARDFRCCKYDSSSLEYRTPPSWLVSPTLAFIFLTLAKICGLLYINKKYFNINDEIYNLSHDTHKGMLLLKRFFTVVKICDGLMEEEDVVKCIEMLENLPNKRINLNWNRDFKIAWQL